MKLTKNQKATLLLYAQDSNGCYGVACARCALKNHIAGRALGNCALIPVQLPLNIDTSHIGQASHETSKLFIKQHIDQFTEEELMEAFL